MYRWFRVMNMTYLGSADYPPPPHTHFPFSIGRLTPLPPPGLNSSMHVNEMSSRDEGKNVEPCVWNSLLQTY